jgi:hypothetical protein
MKHRMFGLVEKRTRIIFDGYKRDPMMAMLMPPERITQAKDELVEQVRTHVSPVAQPRSGSRTC